MSEASRIRLEASLRAIGAAAVAVSGGVDSMTLAVVAHRVQPGAVEMFHAISPAVPPEATARVERYARQEGWRLATADAGEIEDARYRDNPANRCYFCKTHLYGAMSTWTDRVLLSGTNTDDLGDYRPGLRAAAEHRVRHPYVEAEIDKAAVRAIARELGLNDIAELPAAPCLSSRIETGIRIEPAMLGAVHAAERLVQSRLEPDTVRCRLRNEGVVIELDPAALARLDPDLRDELAAAVREGFASRPAVRFASYRMGSAFLHAGTGAGPADG